MPNSKQKASSYKAPNFRDAWHIVSRDGTFIFFLVGAMMELVGYAQIDTTLPQDIAIKLGNSHGTLVYSVVLSVSAVTVVILQILVSKIGEQLGIMMSLVSSQLLFAVSYVLLSVSNSLAMFVVSIVVFSLAEMLMLPATNVFLTKLSSETTRSIYFGAYTFAKIGLFIGPWFGGMVLAHFGGQILFLIMSLMALLVIPFYQRAYQKYMSRLSSK